MGILRRKSRWTRLKEAAQGRGGLAAAGVVAVAVALVASALVSAVRRRSAS